MRVVAAVARSLLRVVAAVARETHSLPEVYTYHRQLEVLRLLQLLQLLQPEAVAAVAARGAEDRRLLVIAVAVGVSAVAALRQLGVLRTTGCW